MSALELALAEVPRPASATLPQPLRGLGNRFWFLLPYGSGPAPGWALQPLGPRPSPWSQAWQWLPIASVAAFAIGWLLVGAGLRPGRRARRGALLAGVLYVVAGLAWLVAFDASLGTPVMELLDPTAAPAILLTALTWPLRVAQVLGVFGLSCG